MRILGIATKPAKKGLMYTVCEARITPLGLEGDYYGDLRNTFRSNRQVTVLSICQWNEAMRELGATLPWFSRRANLCVTEHDFGPDDVGAIIRIGRSIQLLITGETDPCKRMDEILPGLRAALTPSWRGGVTCRVLVGGTIRVCDEVFITQKRFERGE